MIYILLYSCIFPTIETCPMSHGAIEAYIKYFRHFKELEGFFLKIFVVQQDWEWNGLKKSGEIWELLILFAQVNTIIYH